MRKFYLGFIALGVVAAVALGYAIYTNNTATVAYVASEPTAPASPAAPAQLTVGELIARSIRPKFMGNAYSINVIDEATHFVEYTNNADVPRMPASNMKVATAFNALEVLGPQARVTTRVVASGPNDVTIIGAGDATLTEGRLAGLAKRARAVAVARGMGAQVCTKNDDDEKVCKRTVRVHFVDSMFAKDGRAPGWPKQYIPSVVSTVTSLGVLGDYSPTPALNAANMFAQAMSNSSFGATVSRSSAPTTGTELASVQSDNVASQVATMLLHSENNVAEVLFRRVAMASGQQPTWAGGSAAASAILTRAGIPMSGVALVDGSGLSRQNRVTATFLTSILEKTLDQSARPELNAIFYGGAMPVAGKTGTLASRYKGKATRCAIGRIHAKTGTLHDVVSLSGIATGLDGHRKVFAVILNSTPENHSVDEVRDFVDRLVTRVVGCGKTS